MENSTSTENISNIVWYFLPIAVTVPPLGLPANALVMHHLLGKPGICSTSDIFTLNLAVFDMLFCILVLIEYIWLFCNQTWKNAQFLAWGLSLGGGPLLLCLLGLDSSVAVCHPLVFHRLKDPKLRLLLCLVVSAVSATCCCLVRISPMYKWNVIMAITSSAIGIIATCNILILKSLCQSGPNKKQIHPVKKRAFKIVLTTFVLVNVHYLPPITEYLLKQFSPGLLKPFSFVTSVTYTVLSMRTFVQPMCYLIRVKMSKMLPPLCCQDQNCCSTISTSQRFLIWRRGKSWAVTCMVESQYTNTLNIKQYTILL